MEMKYQHLKRKCKHCEEEKYCVSIRAVKKGGGVAIEYICINCLKKEWHKEQMMRKKKFQENKL